MPSTYAPTAQVVTPLELVDDGDSVNAANWRLGVENLADRVQLLLSNALVGFGHNFRSDATFASYFNLTSATFTDVTNFNVALSNLVAGDLVFLWAQASGQAATANQDVRARFVYDQGGGDLLMDQSQVLWETSSNSAVGPKTVAGCISMPAGAATTTFKVQIRSDGVNQFDLLGSNVIMAAAVRFF